MKCWMLNFELGFSIASIRSTFTIQHSTFAFNSVRHLVIIKADMVP